MKDKLLEAMKSPHCLAGIVPDHGGMWVSPCRPGVVYPSADRDDTTPGLSEAERVRLLTYSNVRTDRGVFEAANAAVRSLVAFPNGANPTDEFKSFTIICRASVSFDSNAGYLSASLFLFGGSSAGYASGLIVRKNANAKTAILIATFPFATASGTRKQTEVYMQLPVGITTYAVVVDLNRRKMELFVDGILERSAVIPADVTKYIEVLPAPRINESITNRMIVTGCYYAIFDYAMTAAEIKALS